MNENPSKDKAPVNKYEQQLEGQWREALRKNLKAYDPDYEKWKLEKSGSVVKAAASLEAIKKMWYTEAQQNKLFTEIGIKDLIDQWNWVESVLLDFEDVWNKEVADKIVSAIKWWQEKQKNTSGKNVLSADGVLWRKSLEYADTTYDFDGIQKQELAKMKNTPDTKGELSASVGNKWLDENNTAKIAALEAEEKELSKSLREKMEDYAKENIRQAQEQDPITRWQKVANSTSSALESTADAVTGYGATLMSRLASGYKALTWDAEGSAIFQKVADNTWNEASREKDKAYNSAVDAGKNAARIVTLGPVEGMMALGNNTLAIAQKQLAQILPDQRGNIDRIAQIRWEIASLRQKEAPKIASN